MIVRFDMKKNIVITSGLFAGLFLFAFVAFVIDGFSGERRLLFFPEHGSGKVSGETRRIVKYGTLEENIDLFVQEIVLGPMEIRHARVLPPGTRIRSVLVREKTAIMDLSADVLFLGDEVKLSLEESLKVVKRSVLFNFRNLRDMVITVEGQLPGEPSYFPKDGKKRTSNEKAGKNR